MRAVGRRKSTLLLAVLGLAGAAAPAGAELVQAGNLRVAFSGKLSPQRLPRTGTAPIAVSVAGRIATTDGALAPQLRSLRIELNRGGRLDTRGLPVCRAPQIYPASTERALERCRSALVGRGSFSVDVVLAGQRPYPTEGELLIFNSRRRGRPVLLGQIYSAHPFTTSFVVPFAISRPRGGRYGTALTASLPGALGNWGHVTGLKLRLARRFRAAGERRSFLSAGCPAPKGFRGALFSFARATFHFAGGKRLTSTLTGHCRARSTG